MTPRARVDLKRETKLLHSRLHSTGETKSLVVVDPKDILTFDRVCLSSTQVNYGHSVKCHCSAGCGIFAVAAIGYIIEASRSNYLPGWEQSQNRLAIFVTASFEPFLR
jgi:hypothetical protein